MPTETTPENSASSPEAASAGGHTEQAPKSFPLKDALPLFRAFDEAADAEASRAAPQDLSESLGRISMLIDKLPQRSAIQDQHKMRWMERTFRAASDRMTLELGDKATIADVHKHVLWHVRRASGIGGSEASTVMKHFRGQRGTFGDANTLVKEKLLIMSPQPSTDEMARGVRAEPWIQRMMHERDTCRSDVSALAKLRGFRWDRRPASVGTPDDILMYEGDEKFRRLVDYKAPSADVVADYEANGVSEDYVAQVHHYAILSMAAGAKFDAMSIEVHDPRSFTIKRFDVPFEIELAKEIAASCHRLWFEHVMLGDIPAAPKPDTLDVKDEKVIHIAAEAAMLKIIGAEIEKREKDLIERVALVGAAWHEIATGKLDLGVAALDRSRKWDDEKLIAIAEANGVDVEPFYQNVKSTKEGRELDALPALKFLRDLHEGLTKGEDVAELLQGFAATGVPIKRSLDSAALADHLETLDVAITAAALVGEKFSLTRKSKGPEAEKLIEIRGEASQLVDMIETVVQEQAARVILGEPTPEEKDAELAELCEMG